LHEAVAFAALVSLVVTVMGDALGALFGYVPVYPPASEARYSSYFARTSSCFSDKI